ncbi:hypothetical protein SFRURICE_016541 [Spodoptera frugiperda]|nr:hypothetical protein SFRURICE_016541 [Spodoptera frugiperda]
MSVLFTRPLKVGIADDGVRAENLPVAGGCYSLTDTSGGKGSTGWCTLGTGRSLSYRVSNWDRRDCSLELISAGAKGRPRGFLHTRICESPPEIAVGASMANLPPVLSHGPQSSPLEAVTETWATVVRKNNPHKNTQPKVPAAPSTTQKKGRTIVLPKIPTTAAIAITITEGSSATYAETMYKARQRIKLSEFGIESFNQRIGMTGGMLLEISGADCNAKADKLAARMREVLADIDVRITRPCKMGEIIILDVDESISPVDVVTAVAEVGGCSPDDVKNLDMYVISVRVEWTEAINVMLAPNTVIKQMNAQRKHIDALFVRTWDTKLTTEWAPKIGHKK